MLDHVVCRFVGGLGMKELCGCVCVGGGGGGWWIAGCLCVCVCVYDIGIHVINKKRLLNTVQACVCHKQVLYCIVLYYGALYRRPIRPLSYRHSSGVVRNPHSTLAE